jgi:hypothetical protein
LLAVLAAGAAGFAIAGAMTASDFAPDFRTAGFFNVFDAGLCEAFSGILVNLLVTLAVDLAAGRFAAGFDPAALALAGLVLEDFLRVCLDIRLPFVAFGGSIIAGLRMLLRRQRGWANLPASEYGYRDSRHQPSPFVEWARRADGE